MKEFASTLYDYKYAGMKEGECEDEGSDNENVIKIKLNEEQQIN